MFTTYGGNPLSISRRQLAQLAASAATAAALPSPASAQSRRETLIIGLDIADTITFDPARLASYTTPLTLEACYDTLVTMAPGHYDAVIPSLATKWERLPNSAAWRFTLDPAATFASGAKLTPEDCRFSLDRARRAADGAGQFVTNITTIAVAGLNAIDIELRRPDEAFLSTLASPQFAILERTVVEAQGPNATEWLNQHSAGSGPYVLAGWSRRQSIQLTANPRPWRDPAAFRRVTVANIPYPAAQLRAIQKGDIDVAFNLIPEQIAALESDRSVRIENVRSLDFVYLALTADPVLSKPLANIAVRQAVGAAIDYEDLLGRLLGGSATRPAHFLPIGVPGSTEAIAAQVGYHQNVDRARTLLRGAGFGDGIEIQLSYADDAIAGITYHSLARKLQTDLGRVGIKLKLDMKNPANLRADYLAGKLQAVLAFWHPPVIEKPRLGRSHHRPRRQAPRLDRPQRHPPVDQRRRRRRRPGPSRHPLVQLPSRHGGTSHPDPALPTDLPGRHPQQHRQIPPHRRRLDGQPHRRQTRLKRPTSRSIGIGPNALDELG